MTYQIISQEVYNNKLPDCMPNSKTLFNLPIYIRSASLMKVKIIKYFFYMQAKYPTIFPSHQTIAKHLGYSSVDKVLRTIHDLRDDGILNFYGYFHNSNYYRLSSAFDSKQKKAHIKNLIRARISPARASGYTTSNSPILEAIKGRRKTLKKQSKKEGETMHEFNKKKKTSKKNSFPRSQSSIFEKKGTPSSLDAQPHEENGRIVDKRPFDFSSAIDFTDTNEEDGSSLLPVPFRTERSEGFECLPASNKVIADEPLYGNRFTKADLEAFATLNEEIRECH